MIVASSDETARRLLSHHPEVTEIVEGTLPLAWAGKNETRSVIVGPSEIMGLPELMDNNPMVCARQVGVPPPVVTAIMVAIGPLIRESVLADSPALVLSHPLDGDLDAFLRAEGWDGGAVFTVTESPTPDLVSVAAIASLIPGLSQADFDGIWEDRFGRAFYVNRVANGTGIDVRGRPDALFTARMEGAGPETLASIRVVLDPRMKGGAAQWIHTFNVMNGFEETLGLPPADQTGLSTS